MEQDEDFFMAAETGWFLGLGDPGKKCKNRTSDEILQRVANMRISSDQKKQLNQMIQRENQVAEKTTLRQDLSSIADKVSNELKEKLLKKIKPEPEPAKPEVLPSSMESTCCVQCNMPLFMMCWRHKFRQYLMSTVTAEKGTIFDENWRR
jgi:hypothetical protein